MRATPGSGERGEQRRDSGHEIRGLGRCESNPGDTRGEVELTVQEAALRVVRIVGSRRVKQVVCQCVYVGVFSVNCEPRSAGHLLLNKGFKLLHKRRVSSDKRKVRPVRNG